jgi:hypothetical protein
MSTTNPITDFNIWLPVGIFYLIALFIYFLFSFIIIRQIHLMTQTLNGSMDSYIKTIGYLNLAFSIIIFIVGLIVLI